MASQSHILYHNALIISKREYMEQSKPTDRFRIDSLHIFVLWSFAVAQPFFDLLSHNAEFLVARRSEPSDIMLLLLLVCVLLPALLVLIIAILSMLRWIRRSALIFQTFQIWTYNLLLTGFVAVIALQALHRLSASPGMVLVERRIICLPPFTRQLYAGPTSAFHTLQVPA